HLSATDRCVVLDRTLTVHGFGGSIYSKHQPGDEVCIWVRGESKQEVAAKELLQRFGERHRSAYCLCKEVPNSLAFVISQDGDLRIFANDEAGVYFYDLVHP